MKLINFYVFVINFKGIDQSSKMMRNAGPKGALQAKDLTKLKSGLTTLKSEGYKAEKDDKGNVIDEEIMDREQFMTLRKAIITGIEYSDDVQFTRELTTANRLQSFRRQEQEEYMTFFNQAQEQQFKVMKQAVEEACKEIKIKPEIYKKTFAKLAQDRETAYQMKKDEHDIRVAALTQSTHKVFKELIKIYDKEKILSGLKMKYILEQELERKMSNAKLSLSPQTLM